MNRNGEDRVRDLLAEGWQHLEAGRSREAVDAFGRVLLQNPHDPQGRRGLEQARAAAAEKARLLDVRMEEAGRALDSGQRQRARALLEDVVAQGGDRDRALALLDRLEERGGRLEAGPVGPPEAEPRPTVQAPGVAWSRRAFVVGWAFVIGTLAAGVAMSWDRLMDRLVRTPSPKSEPVASGSGAGATPQ